MSDSPDTEPQPSEDISARALLRERDYVFFWFSRWTAVLGVQIQSVALGWHVYDIARRTMDVKQSLFMVSLIGLVSFVPLLLLALPAGEAADRYNRRRIVLICYAVEIVVAAALAFAFFTHRETIPILLGAAVFFGAARAFFSPANTALGPMLVPRHLLPRAIAWNSLAWQTGSIVGPWLAGGLLFLSNTAPYAAALALYVIASVCTLMVRGNAQPQLQPGSRWALMKEGLAYVWNNKIVFGAISLDLAAVILGGVVALLPVFVRDVLHVPEEQHHLVFGMLRSAQGVGASAVALYLAAVPIRRHAGSIMFLSVALFSISIVVFGLSTSLWLSVVALAVLGGSDMVSVYVRSTLIQLATPDHMRGRVATVSGLFIGASNELGEFETGIVGRILGPVGAAVFGGVGALAVTGLWAWMFPQLRKADRLV